MAEDDDPVARLLRDAEGTNEHGELLPKGTLPLFRVHEGMPQMTGLPNKVESAIKTLDSVYHTPIEEIDQQASEAQLFA